MPLQRRLVTFPEWTPDRPRYNRGLGKAQNVYPRTTDGNGSVSYGPWSAPVPFSAALPSRCVGAFAARSLAGNVSIFAATQTKLYKLTSAGAWTDVSGGTTFSTPIDGNVEFCQFGEKVICTNLADPVQAWTLDVSVAFAALAGSPPKAKHVCVREPGFVVLGHLDVGGTIYPNGEQWSGYNNETSWPTPGTGAAAQVQSDRNILPFGGWVQRLIGPCGGASGATFTDTAIFRVEYAQPPLVFRYVGTVQNRGCMAPFSVMPVAVSNSQTVALFIAEDGIYAFDGTTAAPIGQNKVDLYIRTLFSRNYQSRICAMLDPEHKLVLWMLPTQAGNSSVILAFAWAIGAFSELDPAAMVTAPGEFAAPTLMAQGYTADGLAVLNTPTDLLQFPMDSRTYTGGTPLIGYFDSNHVLNYFTGPTLPPQIDTGQIDGSTIGAPGRRIFCGGVRPITDVANPSDLTAQILFTNIPNAVGNATSPTIPAADGVCPQRISARFQYARVMAAAGAQWTNFQGVEVRVRPEGYA
jgi:hypothetical protein